MNPIAPYDPRDRGARCAECAFVTAYGPAFTPPDLADDGRIMVVLDAPTQSEAARRAFLSGQGGALVVRSLADAGVDRVDVSATAVVLCRPTSADGQLDTSIALVARSNAARRRAGLDPHPTPIECCSPRLEADLSRPGTAPYLVALGKHAAQALLGKVVSIDAVAGAPFTGRIAGREIPALATYEPRRVLQARRYLSTVWKPHIARAARRAAGRVEWVEPHALYKPTAVELANWFKDRERRKVPIGWDTETTVEDSRHAKLKVIGFADVDGGVVVPFMSTDPAKMAAGWRAFYPDRSERDRLTRVIQWAFNRPGLAFFGWNSGYFDKQIVENPEHFGCSPVNSTDLILAHRLVLPELPHSLRFAASMDLDVDAWKADHAGTDATDDPTFWRYNLIDCVVVARLRKRLLDEVADRNLVHLMQMDTRIQEVCRQLHVNGVAVDQAERARLLEEWTTRERDQRLRVVGRAKGLGFDRDDFNPNSVAQVKALLFDHLGMDPVNETALGDPSTDDSTLRAMISGATEPEIRALLVDLRRFRRASKIRGTYLETLPVDPATGRVHAGWLAHGTGVGRRSCNGPNLQNLPWYLRSMYTAAPGHSLVYADWSQIHLRIIAGESQDPLFMDLLQKGEDPHRYHAGVFYGAEWDAALAALQVAKGRGDDAAIKQAEQSIDQMRNFAKCVTLDTLIYVVGRGPVPIRDLQPPGPPMKPGESRPLSGVFVIGRDRLATPATSYYYGGPQPVIRVRLSGRDRAVEIRGTGAHRLMRADGGMWIRLDAIVPGVPIQGRVVAADGRVTSMTYRVESVDSAGIAEVADLEVPHGSSYVANGIVSHNTSTYALMYLATAATYHDTVTSAEDGPEGNLIYADVTLRQSKLVHKKFWQLHPAMKAWGARTVQTWRRQKYLEDPVVGRRCDFLDGDTMPALENALVNFPILAAEQGFAIPAILRAVDRVPFQYAGPGTGMVHDGHDSVMFEVPDADVPRVARVLLEELRGEHKGVPLTAEVKVGKSWGSLKKWKG